MPGKNRARTKLTQSGQSDSFLPQGKDELSAQKIRCAGGKEERGEGKEKKRVARRQECVSLSRKFSQMILRRLTHLVTLSLKPERRGKPSPLLIPLIIAHYLHTALAAERSTRSTSCPAAACHRSGPFATCKVCCLCPWCRQQLLGCCCFPQSPGKGACSATPQPSQPQQPPASPSLWKIAQTHACCNANRVAKLF